MEKGFDIVTIKKGNGLKNMYRRAEEIGAKLLLHSKLNEGTFVALELQTMSLDS
jgi:signal transduction histidine kinase